MTTELQHGIVFSIPGGHPSVQADLSIRSLRPDEYDQHVSTLIDTMYRWRGYAVALPQAGLHQITVAGMSDGEMVGTLTLGIDHPGAGLTVDALHGDEANALRTTGARVCDVTRFAVAHDVQSPIMLGALFHLSVILGRLVYDATHFLIEVNPRHAGFYTKMLGFTQLGDERVCDRVGAAAVLLCLDLSHADAQVRAHGGSAQGRSDVRSAYVYWFSPADEATLKDRLRIVLTKSCNTE